MALKNQYVLNVDLKRRFTSFVPKFRRADDGVLIFRMFDDGVEYNINSATKAILYQRTPSGVNIESECQFTTLDGKRVIRYEYEKIAMVELGYNTLVLVIYENDNVVSIQPFSVIIYDDLQGGAGSYIELIQDLMKIIENLRLDLENTIKLSEKGKPNGVATLDKDGKIPLLQMPKEVDSFMKHMLETIYEQMVHGMRVNEDGILQYDTPNGWQNVGFAPDATGDGGNNNAILNATVSVVDGIATVTYTGSPSLVQEKWATGEREIPYFTTGGTLFTGHSFEVSTIGMHTLWYKDSNGNTYVVKFNVTADMLSQPNINVSVDDGLVSVDIDKPVSIKKWAFGERDIAYFQYNGSVFAGNSFSVTEVGKYTIYYKLTTGVEYVYVFEVTQDMLPVISKPTVEITDIRIYSSTSATYAISVKVFDSNYRITKKKLSNSSQYVDLTSPIEPNKPQEILFIDTLDFSNSNNRNVELLIGVENEIGQRYEATIFADSNYIYYWDSVRVGIARSTFNLSDWGNTSITLPSMIKGKNIDTVGVIDSSVFGGNTKISTLTIPSSIKMLYVVFNNSNLTKVIVNNPNMEYYSGGSFKSFNYPKNTITFNASNNSTTKTFVHNSNNQKFIFQAT